MSVASSQPDAILAQLQTVGAAYADQKPVAGARAYHLHSCCTTGGDADCARILGALRRGYSRVLVSEIIVPPRAAGWPVTAMDQLVLALGGMRERTQAEWEGLLARAGLRVTRVYGYEMGCESLIEAELADE